MLTWLVIAVASGGGLLVAVVVKYADNLYKARVSARVAESVRVEAKVRLLARTICRCHAP